MRITADANVLIRSVIHDQPGQTAVARAILRTAEHVAIPLPALCELVWVLNRTYRKKSADIAAMIRMLLADGRIEVDTAAVQAGLAMLDASGGFADGVIAFDGKRLGGDVFVTFDRQAAKLVQTAGGEAELLASA